MAAAKCILIFLLHRHGMRYPFVHFEGIGEPARPEQLGMLSERGERQMVALGEYLAAKYNAGLGGPPVEGIIAESAASSVLRCVKSAEIFLKSFLGREVKVTTLKTNFGDLYHKMIARNIDAMMSHEFRTDQGDRVRDYVNFLNKQANSTKEAMKDRYQIVESLLTASATGHGLPPYAHKETLEKCLNIINRQLIVGFEDILFTEIVHGVTEKLSKLPSVSSNFVEYSVSDIHIVAVLERLGIGIEHWPGFGSAYEIQIYSDGGVVLNQLCNSPTAEIIERSAIRTTTVENILEKARRPFIPQ